MIRICETGKNPTMRYLHRTHGVSVEWLHETFKSKKYLDLVYETTDRMCADIYTKAFTDNAKRGAVCQLINVVEPSSFSRLVKSKEIEPQGVKAPAGVSLVRHVEAVDWVSPGRPLVAGGCPSASRGGYSRTPPIEDATVSGSGANASDAITNQKSEL